MLITSLDNKKVKDWRKLHNRKYREETNMFLVEGLHLVLEAKKTGCLEELILEENEEIPFDFNTTYVTSDIIKTLSSLDNPVNIIGVCKKQAEKSLGDKLLILDGIQDPGNLGTIIRSAVGFNIDTIILGNNTVDVYNSKCLRGSQGMIFNINIIEKNLLTFIPTLKEEKYLIIGTNVQDGKDLKTIKELDKYALILGNEGNGISSDIEKLCDEFIYIKMNKECESLNVAVACSIILYQLSK